MRFGLCALCPAGANNLFHNPLPDGEEQIVPTCDEHYVLLTLAPPVSA